jgi:hypothetical protein
MRGFRLSSFDLNGVCQRTYLLRQGNRGEGKNVGYAHDNLNL